MIDDLLKKFSKQHKFISQEMLYEMYALVSLDIENENLDRGVWAKAFADAKGNEQVAKAAYIELMVERLVLAKQAEQEVTEQSRRELQKSDTKKQPEEVKREVSVPPKQPSARQQKRPFWDTGFGWFVIVSAIVVVIYSIGASAQ